MNNVWQTYEEFFEMTSIPHIVLVGDKGVGKTGLIKDILSGKKISKNLPILGVDYKFIKINNSLYGVSIIKRICRWFIYETTFAIILANAKILSSLESIPLWHEKIKKRCPNSSINLIISNINDLKFSKKMHDIYYFCSVNKINIITCP
jgi:GTPase SAR1 family protein